MLPFLAGLFRFCRGPGWLPGSKQLADSQKLWIAESAA